MRGPTSRSVLTSLSTDALYEVLSLSLEHAGIKSLARFGACSKRSRELSKSICQQHTRQLLPPLLKLATLKGLNANSTDDKVVAAIDWVAACAGAAALAGLADTLLAIPRVPRSIAFKLINCGVSVTWEQLKAAAKSRIAGVEGWGAGPLMPFMVVAVCSTWGDHRFMHDQLAGDECWLQTPAFDIPNLLHLAVNSQKPEVAQGLLQLMQDDPAHQMQQLRSFHHYQNQQMDEYKVSQQLQVYQRWDCSVPQALQLYERQQQEMQQAWDAVQQRHVQEQQLLRDRPQQLKQLLTTDLVVELLHTAALRGHGAVMGQLFKLDAAHFITADVAAELLHAAVQARSVVGLEAIIKHQAAKQLSADALCSLMQLALQTAFQGAYSLLLQLPAANALNAADVLQLLTQGIVMRDSSAVHKICKLSSASALSAEEIVTLLQHGLTQSISNVVNDLTELPGALLIPTGSMVLLLQTAMQQADITAVEHLMKMDAVDQLDAQQLGKLCKLAMTVSTNSTGLELLLQLPAADDLDDSQVDDLVEAALQQGKRSPCNRRTSFESLKAVVQLPAAHKLRPSLICECLGKLVHVPGSDDLIDMLCGLENAYAIEHGSLSSNNELNSVILTALQLQRIAAANSVSELTHFSVVDTETLQDLLSATIEQKQEGLADKLCCSGAAQQLPCSALVRMLHVATRQRLCNVVGCLLRLIAVADMRADQLADLIKEELNAVDSCTQHTESCILNEYIALDAAAPMHWSQIAELMCLAIQKHKDQAVVQLSKLSGAQDPNAWQLVSSVLHVALQRGDAWMQPLPADSFIVAVCQLPAAKHMSATTLKSLMEAAIRGGRTQIFFQLCQFPAAAELDANAVVELGVIAMNCETSMAAVLSTLPGAALTTRQDVMRLLRTAIATGDICVSALLDGVVRGWWLREMRTRFGYSKLGAAEKLLTEDVAELLWTSLVCSQDRDIAAEHIEAVSALPAVQLLSSDQVSTFLQTAIKLDLDLELRSLCVLHEEVLGPMSDDLISKLLDVADTCMPRCSAEVLEVLSDLHEQQEPSGFVCDLPGPVTDCLVLVGNGVYIVACILICLQGSS